MGESCRPEEFCLKAILTRFAKFIEEHQRCNPFLVKFQAGETYNFIKKDSTTGGFL